jgi:tetratricopeptide (TPR) repeat protein
VNQRGNGRRSKPDLLSTGSNRREFLKQFGTGGAFLFFPSFAASGLLAPSSPFPPSPLFGETETPGQLHLQPHYRNRPPLATLLSKVQPGNDAFVTEMYHEPIAAVLSRWAAELLRSPKTTRTLEAALTHDFRGARFSPTKREGLRPISALAISRLQFSFEARLGANEFLAALKNEFAAFDRLSVAEFQVTGISVTSITDQPVTVKVQTDVRFELFGTCPDASREQRAGYWSIDWILPNETEARIAGWRVAQEERARFSGSSSFADIAPQAFASVASFRDQLLPGVDHWRTVLDGACGIDVYGHNGIALGDMDGDSFDDIYVCQPSGLPNRLYRNRGDGTFEDVTESSGTGLLENTACALFLDVTNSGRQDLVVVRAGGPSLFVNEGHGKFHERPNAFQFTIPPQGTFTGAAAADYDNDGWLDIYFCLYSYYQGNDQYRYPTPYYNADNGPANFLLRNQRDGTFRDVTREAGMSANNRRFSFCCAWRPSLAGNAPDLYVVNDFGRKNLYANDGTGHFQDIAPEAGVEDVGAGMSVSCLDYDNDGKCDLYVANMWTAAGNRIASQPTFRERDDETARTLYRKHAMGNSTLRNLGHNKFEDRTQKSGLAMGRWSWSSDAWDFDQDGFPDVYITNGMVTGASGHDLNSFFWRHVVANSPTDASPSAAYEQGWNAINELIRADGTWSGFERNMLYVNNHDGTFSEVSAVLGMDFIEDARTFALGDLDRDGRVEMLIKNRGGPQIRLIKNQLPDLGSTISFRLQGVKTNRDAIGAIVELHTQNGKQTQYVQAGSGFLAQHSKELTFGLGGHDGSVNATVRWPSGLVQELKELPPGNCVSVREGDAAQLETFRKLPNLGYSEPIGAEISGSHTVETWLLQPISAPAAAVMDASGKKFDLASYRGRPLLLLFTSELSPEGTTNLQALERAGTAIQRSGLSVLVLRVANDDLNSKGPGTTDAKTNFTTVSVSPDTCAIYNLMFRQLYDRHRDMPIPCAFLIDGAGQIVKIYQGALAPGRVAQDALAIPQTRDARLAKALPFSGYHGGYDFGRNYLSLGSIFFDRGYLDASEIFFKLAAKDNPENAEPTYGLGSVYLAQNKSAEARDAFERAVQLPANYPGTVARAWNNLGILDAREPHLEAAVRSFRKSLEVDPNYSVAINNLGNVYRQTKDWNEAQKAFEQSLKLDPEDVEANYGLGMVYAQKNDLRRALAYLKRAIGARPDYPEALNNLGVVYLRLENASEAESTFRETLRVAPEFSQSYLNLARLYSLQGKVSDARAVLNDLLKRRPGDATAIQELSLLPQ